MASPETDITAVSCASATSCTAIAGAAGLPQSWDGTSWTSDPAPPAPSGGKVVFINGISCPAADDCTVVGAYENAFGYTVSLADQWDGSSWSAQEPPNPSGAKDVQLTAVSCTNPNACMAVGWSTQGTGGVDQETLAEAWDGSSWAILTTPTPGGAASGAGLNSVSCVSSSACAAVSHSGTFSEMWNGTKWAAVPMVAANTAFTWPTLSCASADDCVAVGYVYEGPNKQAYALTQLWDGKSWSAVAAGPPGTSVTNGLIAVACAAQCTAVGLTYPVSGTPLPFANILVGSSWQRQEVPPPVLGAATASLSGVSCPASTWCMAVGGFIDYKTGLTLGQIWDGSSWDTVTTPLLNNSTLDAVSCLSSTDCTAVGDYTNSANVVVLLAEFWDGSRWARQTVPSPPGPNSLLTGVSCSAANSCMAVGYYEDLALSTDLPMAAKWDGSEWALVDMVVPPGTESAEPHSVSCAPSGACMAVGSYGENESLAETWDGSAWALDTPTTIGSLQAVSCESTGFCMTVAAIPYINDVQAESWDGTSWTTYVVPQGSGSVNLLAVSCPAADQCTSTGASSPPYTGGGGAQAADTLAEVWDGTSWAAQITPNSDETQSILSAVSCTAANTCEAVGESNSGEGTGAPLAEGETSGS